MDFAATMVSRHRQFMINLNRDYRWPRQARHGVAFRQGSHLTGVPSSGWFGEGSLLKEEPRRYDAVALRPTRVAPGVGEKLQVSQEEIGYLSGISRQRVNQALQTLEKEGLLRVEYGGVTILDLDRLMHR
jgi:CRP-like cAMP-binding protein